MNFPAWFHQLQWSQPFWVHAEFRKLIPQGAGLYAFTINDAPCLTKENVLYVGKADGSRLRTRLSVYLRRFRRPGKRPIRHAGLRELFEYQFQHPHDLFVRWAGCVIARDLEGGLIDLFDPPFNFRDERLVFDDEEIEFSDYDVLPDELFY